MALYIEPPRGNISFKKLETFAYKRLDFIEKIYRARGDVCQLQNMVCEEGTVIDSDCLIVGAAKDKVSHFTLRLLLGGDPDTLEFFCEAETALFDFRFSCMSKEEIYIFLKKLNRLFCRKDSCAERAVKPDVWKSQDINSIVEVFNNIRNSAGSWEKVTELYMAQCSTTYISLPFQSVLGLLRKRQVTLKHGVARVAFSKLREVLVEQFLSLMQLSVKQASQHLTSALADDRLRTLWRKLKHIHTACHLDSCGEKLMAGFSLDQVDTKATKYPLCMSSLLQSLRQKHRLGHHARIQLTLFFKDLGLPIHHAIALWQQEYSQPCGTNSRCQHSWQTDSGRYTYSIRHLYGLEGRRRNYHGHCCQSLQQRSLGCGEEGGCPFCHWDDTTMSSELTRSGVKASGVEDILTLRRTGHFSAACQRYLHCSTEYCGNQQNVTDIEELRVKPDYTCTRTSLDSGTVSIGSYSMDLGRLCGAEDMDTVDVNNDINRKHMSENVNDLNRTYLKLTGVSDLNRKYQAEGVGDWHKICPIRGLTDFSNTHPAEGVGTEKNMSVGSKHAAESVWFCQQTGIRSNSNLDKHRPYCLVMGDSKSEGSNVAAMETVKMRSKWKKQHTESDTHASTHSDELKNTTESVCQTSTNTSFISKQWNSLGPKHSQITACEAPGFQENVPPLGLQGLQASSSETAVQACGKQPNSGSTLCCVDQDACLHQTSSANVPSSVQISKPVHYFSYKCLLENLKM